MQELPKFANNCDKLCKHYLGNWKCKAYPKEIPVKPLTEGHFKVEPDQKGKFIFEPKGKTKK